MKMTCLTKTAINENSKVRFMIITDQTVFSDDLLMSTYKTDDQFKIVGLPMKAKLTSHGYCEIEDSLASELTKEMLETHIFDFEKIEEELKNNNNLDFWQLIQEKIFNQEILSKGYKRKGIYQIALIDEDVYQMCLNENYRSWYGKDLEDSWESFNSKLNDEMKGKDVLVEYQLKIVEDKEDSEAKESLIKMFKESNISIYIDKYEHHFTQNFINKILINSISKDLVKYTFENNYVLNVLRENGYYLMPTNTVYSMSEQTSLTKLLLNDQIAEYDRDSDEPFILPEYEYVISLNKLREQISSWYDEERMNELTACIKEGDILEIEKDSDITDVLYDSLPSYVKYLKIISDEDYENIKEENVEENNNDFDISFLFIGEE